MEHSKIINGKRYYWYGWTSLESQAIKDKDRLELRGDTVKLIEGNSFSEPSENGWQIWRRKREE